MSKRFGETLQGLMEKRNLTGRALAREIKLPYKTVADWIGPTSRMPRDPEALRRLSEFFGVSIHFLLFGEEDPKDLVSQILEKTEIHTGLYEITIKKVKQKGKD